MNAFVFEHVPVTELPQAWRDKIGRIVDAYVTVRIETGGVADDKSAPTRPAAEFANDPLFGMWRDRDDMADVAGYIRRTRAPRFNADGSRNES